MRCMSCYKYNMLSSCKVIIGIGWYYQRYSNILIILILNWKSNVGKIGMWYLLFVCLAPLLIYQFQFNFNFKKFVVSLSTNEHWTLIQVHNHKNDNGLGTTLRDISKLYFFAGWKHVDCAGTAKKKSAVVTFHGGLSNQSLELFSTKQNIPFSILN